MERPSREEFSNFRGTAVCIDARNAWKDLENFADIVDALPDSVHREILFLDAQDSALIKRFSETRRRHPLSGESTPLAEAIDKERLLLGPISSDASLVLDTTQMTIYELRDAIKQRLLKTAPAPCLYCSSRSVSSVACPLTPIWCSMCDVAQTLTGSGGLRIKSGLDAEVQEFLESQPWPVNCTGISARSWIPGCRYRTACRSYMTVAIGCTGGQHRSVYLADRLFRITGPVFQNIHVRPGNCNKPVITQVTIINKLGLHARAAAKFRGCAAAFRAR